MNLNSLKQRYGIIGRAEGLDRALNTAVRVAQTDLTVLIRGESGVGKEVFSRIIHEQSKRKHEKFIAINCGAIPPGTINSELFGHEKGAFTGASADRKGYFETVNGGTFFLDEIGEMPLDTQAYLLRVLESGEFLKVGSSKVLKTDVRVVAATNIDLEAHVKKGKFREDLYYRLNTVPISIPALYQRPEDIYLLMRKFAGDFADKYNTPSIQIDEKGRFLFEHYRWPGNIRELKNVVEQLSVMAEDKFISVETLVDIVPVLLKRNLPAKTKDTAEAEGFHEREMLFKFLLDMKEDLNDVKKLIFNLIKSNDLNVPDMKDLRSLSKTKKDFPSESKYPVVYEKEEERPVYNEEPNSTIILNDEDFAAYQKSEIVEENLSLEEMEKSMIKKALKKYSGKRRDAANELGISERTLYRKIKQYDIPD